MRKPNVQSPLDRLPDAHQHKLYEMLKGASYEEALPNVRAEFGVRTTVSSLSRFMKRRGLVETLRENIYASEAFAAEADVKALDRRKRSAVVSAMWEALNAKDTKSIVALGKLIVSMDIDRRREEQIALAREKFEAAERRLKAVQDAVEKVKANGGGLSEEALAKIEQAVGML